MLEKVNSPEDIKKLSVDELKVLAKEIRNYIIEVVSKRGGHLASSLGAVEITVSLHYVFDSPRDKIIWDVGHQSYAHKILTGRREKFTELRTRGGLSGFPSIFESEHDIYGVGHASTSISAALGIATARDLKGEDFFVVSVVGDGALTGGLAFEGINQAGHLKKNKFIIILNDNEMSISKNVGALSRYLTKISTKKLYLQMEADVWELLGKIPSLGGKARKLAKRIKESIKNLVVPTILFEELGFRYIGPMDGHNIEELVSTFREVQNIPGPVLVHVVTQKGKGYFFAEKNAEKFHGVGSFYKATGNSRANSKKKKYSEVFGDKIVEMASKDNRIVAITAAMKDGTGLKKFSKTFPERFFDVGIAEQHAVTFACGLARHGMKPFVAIYSTFLQRSYDQLIHDVALQNLPIKFVLDRAGLVGEDGPTHHGAFDLSYLRLIPNFVLMSPADEYELTAMLELMGSYSEGPIAVRFPRGAVIGEDKPVDSSEIKIGRSSILVDGNDIAIIAVGSVVHPSLDVARELKERNINASVVNTRFIKPLDEELILGLSEKVKYIFTIEENTVVGGFGDAVQELLSSRGICTPVERLGIPDRFISHGTREELLDEVGLSREKLVKRIVSILDSKRSPTSGGNR